VASTVTPLVFGLHLWICIAWHENMHHQNHDHFGWNIALKHMKHVNWTNATFQYNMMFRNHVTMFQCVDCATFIHEGCLCVFKTL
jgi:hypothetical protein